jgi:acyl carrier protein
MSRVNFDDFIAGVAEALEIEVSEVLEIEAGTNPSAHLRDLEAFDSMGHFAVSMQIEDQFGFSIDYDTLADSISFKALYEYCIAYAK